VKVFGCRPVTAVLRADAAGVPKTSKGGNRGKRYVGDAAFAMGI
jgi:hypothetical protein